MNSLLNQQEICRAFAERQGHQVIGQSSDDNASGMNFSRRGLDELTAAVDAGRLDAILVKDCCAIMGLNQKDLENQGILA